MAEPENLNTAHPWSPVDLAAWKRGAHYRLYSAGGFPYVGATVRLDITEAHARCSAAGVSFFAAFLYLAARAVNELENFRYRVTAQGEVILCEQVDPSWTVLDKDSELFYFAKTAGAGRFRDFAPRVKEASARAVSAKFLRNDRLDVFYTSALPWLDFSDCIQPLELSASDATPRLVWGKYTPEGSRLRMPVSCTAHHGFVDGLHLGRLMERLQQMCLDFDPAVD